MIDTPIQPGTEKEAWEYWYPLVFGYFYRRVNDRHAVEELTANTLNALFMKEDVRCPKGFVWQTARNQLYKYIHNKQDEFTTIDISEYEFLGATWDEEVEEEDVPYSDHFTEKLSQLKSCLQEHLKEDDYLIILAAVGEELNSSQLAKKFDIKPVTIRQKIRRGFQKLKDQCNTLWVDLQTA